MLPRIPKFFNFELHQSRRDRLRLVFKPRLELLEHRLAPSVNVSSPGDQTTAEGAFPTPTFNMGSFTDDNAIGNPWRVTVMWGDGTTSPFTVNQQGSLGTQRHNYGEEGVFPVTITVTDSTGVTGSTNFNISVFDPPVSVSAVNFSTVNSMALTNQVVATFTDPGKPEPNANDPGPLSSHYSATIDWGDFSGSTPATITLSGTVFTVTGNHTYAQPNTYQTTVTVFHESAPASASTGTATVTAAPLVVTTPGDQVSTEGTATSFSLGSFSDTTANATSWRVDVNWGDNTAHTVYTVPSQGTLGNQPHNYGEEGTYVVTVTVTDNLNQMGAATFNVTVADPAVNASGINFSGVSNSTLTNQAVATFTDPGGAEPNASDPNGGVTSHYSATIDWGDFSGATAGTITLSNGVFTVSGSHSYTGSGTFPINVTVSHEGAPQTFAQGQATISTNPVSVSSAGDQLSTEGTATSFNLGSFSDTASGANSWRVDINWGDNTAHTTFTTNTQGTLGSRLHSYGEEGTYPVTVTITDNLNQTGSTTFNASVADPAVSASATNFTVASNTAFTHAVATFTDPGGAEPNASD
ncbi:MAG TPA: hypothetical protein VKU02_21615, partial [Gemmataceae bacterium]|nr:hypothetical protein [Gemmataceae bacterium]